MRTPNLVALVLAAVLVAASAGAQRVVLRADRVLDGTGKTLPGGAVVVEGDKIAAVTAPEGVGTYDLRGLTLLPGLIDAHSHPTWYFNRQGRFHTRADGDTPVQSMLSTVANAYATLLAGVTTLQSPGSPEDRDLRDWIDAGQVPGPRVLTSLEPLANPRLSPDSLRAVVRQRKAEGADLIKIFASASIRDGGQLTLTDEQLRAACGEAKAQGLRTLAMPSPLLRTTLLLVASNVFMA